MTYNYDYNFNLREAPNWWGVFDAESRLTMAGGGGNVVMFTYDGLGRCVKRVVYPPGGGSRMSLFTYDGWKPVMEWDGAGNCLAWNIYGSGADEILWRCQAGVGNLRYHHDVHGNVAFVLGDGGEALERYSYDAFGKPKIMDWAGNERTNGTAIGNRFLFQGREWIAELGVYDYRHRMYNPGLGRFLQTDPMGLQTEGEKLSAGQKALFSPGGSAPEAFSSSEMNLFRYCGDDPVDGSDPTGLETLVIYGAPYSSDWRSWGGHISIATTGQGLQSAGNNPQPTGPNNTYNYSHSSTTAFLASQSQLRHQTLVVLHTTSKQEETINRHMDSLSGKNANKYTDNCAQRASTALKEAGVIDKVNRVPVNLMDSVSSRSGAAEYEIQRGSPPDRARDFKQFDPKSDKGR